MPATNKDKNLRARINSLIQNLEGSDKEVINQIAAICGISYRTAREHFNILKTKLTFDENQEKANCQHVWSMPFSTPGGLVKECAICGATENVVVNHNSESSLAKLDAEADELLEDL